MLNELLIVERGARQAGLSMYQLHPDVKECRGVPTIVVKLDEHGDVTSIQPVPSGVKLWTLRDGQHNSFPFVQPKRPLLDLPPDDERRRNAVDRRTDGRRSILLQLAEAANLNPEAIKGWPGDGLLNRLRERQQPLSPPTATGDAGVFSASIERFLRACQPDDGPARLLRGVIKCLTDELRQTAQADWLDVAVALLIGKFNAKRNRWECTGALLFDAFGFERSVADPRVATEVSKVLSDSQSSGTASYGGGICSLTGEEGPLLSGNFPQPNLPALGQTYIFAKNPEIKANDRYRRFATDAMPVGRNAAVRLAAAIRALTGETRKNVTWRRIPGEVPKQTDLLLAFVAEVPEAPAAETLAGLDDEDYSEEGSCVEQLAAGSIAVFEKRTERLIEAVRGQFPVDFRQTPVRVAIFRQVDPANRKVVYTGAATLAELYDAAITWAAGERNVPPWFTLPVLSKGEKKPRPMAPPHIAPLGLIPFSKQLFIRGGTEKQELLGLPAAEALALFFEASEAQSGRHRVRRILRLVLRRRGALVSETAHKLRFDALKKFDRRETLRTVAMLGLLLHKLGRTKEVYMREAAFKLGQLLAAADAVHAGYCAHVRGGNLPPSLLGNQVFTTAQSAPTKALATLGRRWKPYDGWAKKAAREREWIDKMAGSKKPDEKQRGWTVRVALRQAREMKPLADELAASLASCVVDDEFRAELLLGYIAGLPKGRDEETDPTGDAKSKTEKEDEG